MPDVWQTSVLMPIFKERGDVRNYNAYRKAKLLGHAMKIAERMLERKIQVSVNVGAMQSGFVPGRRTTNALFL